MVTYPKDWTETKLLDHVELVQGLTYTPDNVKPHGTLVLRSSNIQNGRLSLEDSVYVDSRIPEEKMIQAGDILVCVRNGSSALIGKSCVLPAMSNTTFGAFMSVLRGDSTGYIAKVFESDMVQEQVRGRSNATINQITKKDFKSIVVTVPDELEQKDIATAIGSFDLYVSNITELIEKKKAIRDGALNDLLSGRTRLAGFSGKLCNKALGAIVKVERGKRLVRNQLAKQGAFPVYQNSMEPLGYYVQYNCEPDSTFIIAAGSAGETGFSKCAFWAADDCYYFKHCPDLSQQYLYYLLLYKQSYLKEQSRRTSIPRLSRDVIDGLEVCMHSIDEQKAIAESLSAIDEEIKALGAEREKMIQIREGVMDDLLTGRVRLNV